MTRLHFPLLAAGLTVVFILTTGLTIGTASADVFGRLRVSVKNAADEKPVSGAKITLKDTANVRADITLTTNETGAVESPQLDARPWRVLVEAENLQTDSREVNVVADATTDVEVLLEPLKEKVIRITGEREVVSRSQTSVSTRRDPDRFRRIPSLAGNPQNLRDLLRSTPGLTPNSVNQIHPRGEHSATGIYINGFYLPGALQGRAGQILTPQTLQNLEVITGGFSPEFGGETGATLNLNLRSGTLRPFRDLVLQGGSYDTIFGDLTLSGQAGPPTGPAAEGAATARRFAYFVDVNGRRTDNALEPPQPQDQDAHNRGSSQSYFGNFDYQAGKRDTLRLTLNSTPAYTQVANRVGLPGRFAPFGQGFGYGGGLSAAEARALGITSQQGAGQDINQRDENFFGVFSWRRNFSNRTYGSLSVGGVNSALDIRNNNPRVNLQALPEDNSIEFNPTILRSSRHIQPQGSVTHAAGRHTLKVGFLYDSQSGVESYQLTPGSQLALNALAATDRRLVPAGSFRTGPNGKPVLDRNENPIYDLAPGANRAPVLRVNRSGYYGAAFAQDTWNAGKLTLNYGLRADWYRQEQNLGQQTVDEAMVSPRFNLAYAFDRKTVGRFSYNRLFTQPPLAQGAIIGQPVQPQTNTQFDLSFERQTGRRQFARAAFYNKNIRNLLDTGLLLEGTQIGAFTTVTLDRARVQGVELTYELLPPREGQGLGAYVTWSNSIARPGGFTNTGEPVERYTDHDQLNTINFGASYTLKNGANAGFNLYYGSGVASSVLSEDGPRNPRAFLNLILSTGPRLFGRNGLGAEFVIENVTDDRSLINFASPFSGTRFQQGRRFLLSVFGRF